MPCPESLRFQSDLQLCLGWCPEPVTLRELADLLGTTVSKVRYHVAQLGTALTVTKDRAGRVLVQLTPPPPAPENHGTIIRMHDGAVVGPAKLHHVQRARRAAARELRPRSGAPEPGLGVIVVGGFRCFIEPPFELAAE